MPGLRIHHPTHRNCTLLVRHPGEIKSFMKTKYKGRKGKDYRITLDNEGNAIVSNTVWNRLQETGLSNFIILNEVIDPPSIVIGFKEGRYETLATYRQMKEAVSEIAPPGVTAYVRRGDG